MGLGRNIKNSCYQFLRLYARRASAAQLRINIHTRSRVITIAHPVLTIPYVWRVTHEYINEGLKQGLKKKKKFSCQSLGYKQSKDIIIIIVNIYKICFTPLTGRAQRTIRTCAHLYNYTCIHVYSYDSDLHVVYSNGIVPLIVIQSS